MLLLIHKYAVRVVVSVVVGGYDVEFDDVCVDIDIVVLLVV